MRKLRITKNRATGGWRIRGGVLDYWSIPTFAEALAYAIDYQYREAIREKYGI